VRAKLRPPAAAGHYVRRPRLLDLLDEAIDTPLVLVVAPAGAGKTSLVADWIERSALPAAWLALDEADRDGVQLWSGLIAALETLAPGCGESAQALLRRPGALPAAVDRVLDDLDETSAGRSVLVIDDVQLVDEDDTVAESLARFVHDAPSWLHLILVSRRRPRVPLDRLRARGQLGEVGFAELRLSSDEATELMSRLAPSLDDEQIKLAVEHADGWAAGLQMAALAARSTRAIHGREGLSIDDDVLVHDYVLREALAGEAPELVDALVDVSIVERVNGSLAQVLTGRPDAEALLRSAEDRGLFIARVGVEGWFEMHSLVRTILTAELTRRGPRRASDLHMRAARWFEQAGEVTMALNHWLLADRPRDALRLLVAEHANLYDSGREATVGRVLFAIPLQVAMADLDSLMQFAWCHLLVSRTRFLDLVGQVNWWAERTPADEAIRARLAMLRSIAATMTGHWVEGGAFARHGLAELGDGWWRDPIGRFAWNMAAREAALSERWDDDGDEIRAAEMALSRDPERRLSFEGTRALGEALAGRPVDAMRVVAGVQTAATVTEMSILRWELALADAVARREVGERRQAVTELEALMEMPAEAMLYCRVFAGLELVDAHLDAGDLEAAQAAFERVELLAESKSFGGDGRDRLARSSALVALAAGDVEGGRRWAAEIADPFWSAVSRARVDLARGDRSNALAALESAVPRCPRHEVVLALLLARATDDPDESLKHAASAVEQAASVGMLQTVASEGAEVLGLVEKAAWRAPPSWMDRVRRASIPPARRPPSSDRESVDALTARERDILRFLPSRLTLREIAGELYISVNTLKFHLKVIYRKLGVSSRGEAAEAARRMALLRPDG
jgi:LuxR family maltose regulon positive regulatory protein